METICLLASEVVHLMCLVPMFFELLEIDQGTVHVQYTIMSSFCCWAFLYSLDVIHMVAIATRNNDVVDVVNHIKWNILDNGVSMYMYCAYVIKG